MQNRLGLAGAGCALLSLTGATAATNSQPNIVFILVDDLGYADVGFNGSTYFETPIIDQLASQSVVFNNSYMYPTSSPSRAAIFTGQQSFRTGVYVVPVLESVGDNQENIFSRWSVDTDIPFYSEVLDDAGYSCIHLGKWHMVGPYPVEESQLEFPFKEQLTQPRPEDFSWVEEHKTNPEILKYYPESRGFDKNVGGTYRGDPALLKGGYGHPNGGYKAPFTNPFIENRNDDEWLTDRLTDDAISFMDEHRDSPFFINLHYYAVHAPIISRGDEETSHFMTKAGDETLGQGVGKMRKKHANYATMIESVDNNIGRIVEFLDRAGLRENTVIVFTSDNGYNGNVSANNLMRGAKGQVYEGGLRVPTFVNWKGEDRGRVSESLISPVDYFPTFLDIASINYKGVCDGESMVPKVEKERKSDYERPILWQLNSQYLNKTCTIIREGDYKLIQFLATGDVELYNLKEDSMESQNIAQNNPKVVARLVKYIEKWRKDNGVPLPPNSVVK